jgi:hypothetical protein
LLITVLTSYHVSCVKIRFGLILYGYVIRQFDNNTAS